MPSVHSAASGRQGSPFYLNIYSLVLLKHRGLNTLSMQQNDAINLGIWKDLTRVISILY
jgi:hypothetical protein